MKITRKTAYKIKSGDLLTYYQYESHTILYIKAVHQSSFSVDIEYYTFYPRLRQTDGVWHIPRHEFDNYQFVLIQGE